MYRSGVDPLDYHKMRYQEVEREAHHQRLVYEALKSMPPRLPVTANLLAALGRRLVAFGARLEKRYGGSSQVESRLQYKASTYRG